MGRHRFRGGLGSGKLARFRSSSALMRIKFYENVPLRGMRDDVRHQISVLQITN
jgi:hypothetical protein